MTLTMDMVPLPESTPRDLRKLLGQHPFDGITVGNLSPALAIEIGMEDSTQSGVVVLQVGPGLGSNVSFSLLRRYHRRSQRRKNHHGCTAGNPDE